MNINNSEKKKRYTNEQVKQTTAKNTDTTDASNCTVVCDTKYSFKTRSHLGN